MIRDTIRAPTKLDRSSRMRSVPLLRAALLGAAALAMALPAHADENLFGYVKGSETLPKGAAELYQFLTLRADKGQGRYRAWDSTTELEYGVTDRFTFSGELKAMAIDTSGLVIDGYLPQDKKTGLRASGFELGTKYNFLSPAKDDFGLSGTFNLSHSWIDKHSGQKKKQYNAEFGVQAQKYFMEGQLVWVGNASLEATWAKRDHIDNLPADFDWPEGPEMEVEPTFGTGLTYRFAPGWFAGVEAVHQSEYETEVGKERWSLFAGPTLHYASNKWWGTLTYFRQLRGGGEGYEGQPANLHLIEKTRYEVRLKVGYNF
jgi:hypothetical protein